VTPPEDFFAPLPPAPEHHDEPPVYPDLPFQVPINVIGVPMALRLGLARTMDTLVVLSHAVVYHRGLTLTIDSWARPGTELDHRDHPWEALRPRFGVLLEDGTKVGHDPTTAWAQAPAPGGDGVVAPGMVQVGGGDGLLTTSTTWWLYPFPDGLTLDLVVAWADRGIPETRTRLDLAPMHSAAALVEPLWPLPPAPAPLGRDRLDEGRPSSGGAHPVVSLDPSDPGFTS